jgi:pyruvate/2-oxoglutarate dehydrogenase complex dihydrolipoamide dehydrogenase (E3) component
MLVIGGGATGVQVASIFDAFGSQVTLYEAAPRASGIEVLEDAGTIERFEPAPAGVRMTHSPDGARSVIDKALAVVAVGWVANTADLNLAAAGIELDQRGYVRVDSQLRTTAAHIFAARDVTGQLMVVHEAVREAYLAATNAVLGETTALPAEVSPIGSFTDPEYTSVGLTETAARKTTSSWPPSASTRCRARSSTAAAPDSASCSPTAGLARSWAATSWENARSNWRSSRRSR